MRHRFRTHAAELVCALLLALPIGCANSGDGQRVGRSNPPAAPRHVPPEIDVGPGRGVYHLSNELTADQAAALGADDAKEADASTIEVADEIEATEVPSVDAPAPEDGRPRVALARFTTAVEDREPTDAISFLDNDQAEILFYTDLRNLSGKTVVHRWEYEGEIVAEVPFEVGGDRWRVWSSKQLVPEKVGDYSASVVAPDGEVLASERFSYQVP